ncbi:glycosyltransferase family 2 protein [Alicyclobacillus macrosporangiidus]|uniref:Glycosyltransferase involved in cell wall bisynthesis n=1 Tax=Alicyclobacillus macrosporangiidus TaxID=392015 RepID=A0A1I7FJF3_9BACL|nr:glycosyltransferase family 2 protein [Alicyclobacillus macrosporangiidus]SFU36278.1 Glycosyltransferase involved in cell wall bisynthesis [Alicyclobacillus macrosporangiidus]
MALNGWLLAVVWSILAAITLPGLLRVPRLSRVGEAVGAGRSEHPNNGTGRREPSTAAPGRVSVVIAARDEGSALADTLAALTAQTLADVEIIVVDDRSQDDTWTVISRFAAADPRVRGIRVTELPEGWIGKNHALYRGALAATGAWLVFMDADVRLHPRTLEETAAFSLRQGFQHVTAIPRLKAGSTPLATLMLVFALNLVMFLRPQNACRGRWGVAGIGAFQWVDRSRYLASGGHAAIRMRPDDDAALGRLLKRSGCRQCLVRAGDRVSLAWYERTWEMIEGLEKSPIAAFRYRPWALAAVMPLLLALYEGPVIGTVTGGHAAWGYGVAWAVVTGLCAVVARGLFAGAVDDVPADTAGMPAGGAKETREGAADRPAGGAAQTTAGGKARRSRTRWRAAAAVLLWPVGAALLAFAYLRAAWKVWRHGGLMWRGTLYPLEVLRREGRWPTGAPGARR